MLKLYKTKCDKSNHIFVKHFTLVMQFYLTA